MKNGERTKNGKGKRQANFELLRIISMFMVVSLHYLSHADALTVPGTEADGTQRATQLVCSLSHRVLCTHSNQREQRCIAVKVFARYTTELTHHLFEAAV